MLDKSIRLAGTPSLLLSFFIFFAAAFILPQTAFSQEDPPDTASYDKAQCPEDHDSHDSGHGKGESRYSDKCIPLADLPDRPKPLLELGEPFLGTGTLKQGIRLPTGAVWQPAFLAFGTLRSAVQSQQLTFQDSDVERSLSEAAFRLDLFGNLYLTSTERVVIGFRPLDQDGAFTRYTFDSDPEIPDPDCDPFTEICGPEEFQDELNFGIRSLFFEGDLGELFPAADWADKKGLDIGISVGRQPLSFQDGLLINEDAIDAVGLTRANLKFKGLVNVRVTGLFAWGDIDRTLIPISPEEALLIGVPLDEQEAIVSALGRNTGDGSATLFGIFTETDTRKTTIEADIIFVSADDLQGDGLFAGLSGTRRYGRFSNTWRAVGSFTVGDEGLRNSQGYVFTNQFSWTPHHSHNHVYINLFGGIDAYRSAARGPAAGGPLGLVGVLYSAVGIGRFPAALSNQADDAVGGAFGYQFFFKHTRQQLILEVGGRYRYKAPETFDGIPLEDYLQTQIAGGGRYQIAVARRGVLVFDLFGLYDIYESTLDLNSFFVGGRFEVQIRL
ncbi:MAG: hypothetical protein KTR29_08790 [Rhodothermaceae bacterium]|nr:hypothetical protein [Rhodothermaceae bacterium]